MSRYSWLREGVESAPITSNDLQQLENYADKLFAKVGIDVEFTRHFLDRVNDERNQRQITMAELTRLFKQEFKKWGKKIAQLGPDAEAVMKDMKTDVNMPFVLVWDKNNQELDLVAKTVMRKKDFKTTNPEFAVESVDPILAFIQDKEKTYELSYGNCGVLAIALDQKFDMDEFVYVTNDAEPDKLYHVAAVKNGKIYDADGITNISNVRARGLDDEYPDEEPQVDHVPAVETEYSYILKGTDPDIGTEDLLEDVTQAADLAMRFSQFSPEELAQLAIFLGVALPTLKAMFATYTGYRKLKKMIKKKLAMESQIDELDCKYGSYYCSTDKKWKCRQGPKQSRNVNEENVYDMFKKYIAPKIKSKAYTIAAQQLDKLLRKKKGETGKLAHNIEYYAQRLAGTFDGIEYRTLVDYYRDNYDTKAFESKYTDMELALMEGGHSINEADDPKDIISMDVPLFVRILELSRETIKTDADLHHVVSKIIDLTKEQDAPLDMKAYQAIEYVLGKDRVDEVLRKVKNPEGEMQWALVSKSDPKKVLQYYRGPKGQKPSEEWYNKVERRVQAFKHMGESSSEPGRWEVIGGVRYYMVTNKSGKTKAFSGPTPAAKKYKETGGKYPWESVNENFTIPQFDVEWEEANRYDFLDKLGKDGWIKLAQTGKAVTVDSNSVKKIGNTGADGSETFDDLEPEKVARFKKAMKSGTIEMPIVMKMPNGELELIAGNTRLIGLINTQGKAKVWYIDASKLEEGGVGIITKQNTTQDVKPGETQRQAAKLGMKLDKNTEPPKLHKKSIKNSTPNKLFNLGIK